MTVNKILLNEKEYVEEPFLRQLERLGWTILRAGEEGKYDPAITMREGFNEVIIEKELKAAIKKLNDWVEDDQIPDIIRQITLPQSTSLIDANKEVLEVLLEKNPSVENRKNGTNMTARVIDFRNPLVNSFLAVSQFKVNIPGTENHIIPDITLFINGLPIAVVECKSPYVTDPIGEAITQLMRYSNRRDVKEGNEKLFWFNQIVVATSRQKAVYSTISGEHEHFVEWKDPYPLALSQIETEGGESVNSQQIMIQGMFAKENLLDIIQACTVFKDNDKGKLIKVTARYQQFRTMRKIISRLKSKKPPEEKGGIVWHTQGSGKSLTMVFIVRKMFYDKDLAGYKIVFINDRRDLKKQLTETSQSIGFPVLVANRIAELKEHLRSTSPNLVMGMIQGFQERELQQKFPELNASDKILVLADESHREKSKFLGANMKAALPNAVYIGFTGTPTEPALRTFGDYIDKYSMRQARDDGVTVEIVYEGRTHKAEITDHESMNKRFEDVFSDINEEERQKILGRYTWKTYLEARETIREKASDMLNHYIKQIFPNGFKAQIVAVSRIAAVRYKEELDKALKEIIDSAKKSANSTIDMAALERMKIEVVISGSANDEPNLRKYTDSSKHENIIKSFKLPFNKSDENGVTGDVGIIIVCDMLLTGFDAPIEQVMYLDQLIKEHNLLQAIARVNRPDKMKYQGFVVDYVGITKHLREALSVFDREDVNEVLSVLKSDDKCIDGLKFSFSQIKDFFGRYDIKDVNDVDSCIDLLADEEIRNEFVSLFKSFSKSIDAVLPRKEALNYVQQLRHLSFISQSALNRYRDHKLSLKDASKKIRDIVDEYLISNGVDPKISPVPIFDKRFQTRVNSQKTDKAKAEEMRYAISQHIDMHRDEDPEMYDRFAEKLEKLMQQYQQNWELLAKELQSLLEELRQGRMAENNFGFRPDSEMPFFGLLKREIFRVQNISDLSKDQLDLLVQVTKDLLEITRRELVRVDFWNNITAQKRLKSFIVSHILESFRGNQQIFTARNVIAQKILELSFHLNEKLISHDTESI